LTFISSTGEKIGSIWIADGDGSSSWDGKWQELVWTGNEFGLVWQDERDGVVKIYFARIGRCP